MAKVVNYAGTVLTLNTDKYSKSLKKMKSESSSIVKSIGSSFKALAASFAGMFAVGKSFSNVVSSLKDYESKVSSLSAITGSIQDAKLLFSELNSLSRELPQSFDDITASAVNLNKAGLSPTKDMMKAISAIAVGTQNSLATVSQIVSSASLGRIKSLQQLGITAVRVGDQIELTYKGQKETIEANNEALSAYIQKLANVNFGDALKFQMDGMTGATKNLGDAWSDLWTAIATGDAGQEIANIIFKASQALDSFTASLQSPEIQQLMGGFVRLFDGAFSTISNGLSNLWSPFKTFFDSLDKTGNDTCQGQIGYFEGWFDFVRLGLGDLISYLDVWWNKLQLYAERAGSILYQSIHGTTQDIMNRADLSVKMLEKVKELGLENSALVKRNGKVDLSAILQLPKGHPLLDYYNAEKKRIVESNKDFQNTEIANQDAFDKQLDELDKKRRKERNEAYDTLRNKRIELEKKLAESGKGFDYKNVFQTITSGSGAASKGMGGLKNAADEARKAYEQLASEIERMKFAALDDITQENIKYNERLGILNNALLQQTISNDEYRKTEEELTRLHIDKLTELYDAHYKEEADKRKEQLDKLREQEKDWSTTNDDALSAFTDKLNKYSLTWNDLILGNFENSKLTATQIIGVYAQASGAIGNYIGSIAQGFEKGSGAYKALFALQKSFAVASGILSIYQGALNAMAAPYPENLIAWMQVLGQGFSLLAQLKNVEFSGAYDRGGYIPSGAVGLVGEIGPELVRGPATVTSRRDTLNAMSGGTGDIVVNLYEDSSRAGQSEATRDNDKTIIDVFVSNIRRGGETASVLESTYGLARVGY